MCGSMGRDQLFKDEQNLLFGTLIHNPTMEVRVGSLQGDHAQRNIFQNKSYVH